MSELGGRLYVTPHAVRRFQQRIACLEYDQALAAIIHGLAKPYAMRFAHERRDGVPVINLAVVGKYQFIATIVPNPDPALLPAVVSIRYGTKGGNRKPEYQRCTWRKL